MCGSEESYKNGIKEIINKYGIKNYDVKGVYCLNLDCYYELWFKTALQGLKALRQISDKSNIIRYGNTGDKDGYFIEEIELSYCPVNSEHIYSIAHLNDNKPDEIIINNPMWSIVDSSDYYYSESVLKSFFAHEKELKLIIVFPLNSACVKYVNGLLPKFCINFADYRQFECISHEELNYNIAVLYDQLLQNTNFEESLNNTGIYDDGILYNINSYLKKYPDVITIDYTTSYYDQFNHLFP
jgi:hypothetical protein